MHFTDRIRSQGGMSLSRATWVLIALTAVLLVVGACSSDGESGESPPTDDIDTEAVGDAVSGAGEAVSDAVGGGTGGEEEPAEEKLPTWAAVLLVVLAVVAVIGLVIGLQNRNARKTEEATEAGYRQAQEDQATQAVPTAEPADTGKSTETGDTQ